MIYIFKNIEGFYKIGFTKNCKQRLKQLNTGNSSNLEIICEIQTISKKDRLIESIIHKNYNFYRLKGEWFDLTDDHINDIKEKVCLLDKNLEKYNKIKSKFNY